MSSKSASPNMTTFCPFVHIKLYLIIIIYVHITRWTSSSNIECLAESDSSGKKRSVGTPIARWTKTWPAALFTLIFQICRWQHLSTQPRRPQCHHKAQDAGQTGNLHQASDANNSQGPKAFPGKTNPTHRRWCAKMGKACRDTKNKKKIKQYQTIMFQVRILGRALTQTQTVVVVVAFAGHCHISHDPDFRETRRQNPSDDPLPTESWVTWRMFAGTLETLRLTYPSSSSPPHQMHNCSLQRSSPPKRPGLWLCPSDSISIPDFSWNTDHRLNFAHGYLLQTLPDMFGKHKKKLQLLTPLYKALMPWCLLTLPNVLAWHTIPAPKPLWGSCDTQKELFPFLHANTHESSPITINTINSVSFEAALAHPKESLRHVQLSQPIPMILPTSSQVA